LQGSARGSGGGPRRRRGAEGGAIAWGGYDGFLYSIGFLVGWLVALMLVAELLRMFRDDKAIAPPPSNGRDTLPMGRAALRPAIELALRYATAQHLLPRRLDEEEVWDGLPAELETE